MALGKVSDTITPSRKQDNPGSWYKKLKSLNLASFWWCKTICSASGNGQLIDLEILRNFCAIEAASATRLSSENRGESSIRSPGLLLNSIKYCRDEINKVILTHSMQMVINFMCLDR